MATTTGIDALRQVPLFANLHETPLAGLAGALAEASYPPGAHIVEMGDADNALYLIRQGKVKVVLPGHPEEAIVAILDDGDFFGELSLCDGRARSATVVALEPTSAYLLPRDVFLDFLKAHPPAAIQVLEVLACRLRDTTDRFSESIFLDLRARLAKRLLQLAAAGGEKTEAGVRITQSLTVDEIAALVGARSSQVETELRALCEVGIIHWDGTTITVRDPELLTERTCGDLRYVGLGHITVPHWLLEP